MAFARYAKLDRDSSEFFLDLVNRDKAGNDETREHFQDRIKRRLTDRQDLKRRLKIKDALTSDQEARYYDGWLPQAVHICCQLAGHHSIDSIARTLQVDEAKIDAVLQQLVTLGLVEESASGFRSLRDSVHLGKDSPLIGRFHSNWRLKTTDELLTTVGQRGSHYSSVVSMSHETAAKIRELILRHLEDSRALIIPSPPDELFVYCLDFYQLTHSRPEAPKPSPKGTGRR